MKQRDKAKANDFGVLVTFFEGLHELRLLNCSYFLQRKKKVSGLFEGPVLSVLFLIMILN